MWVFDTLRGVEHFQRDEGAILAVVENDTGLVFIALGHGRVAKDERERVRCLVVARLHLILPSFSIFGPSPAPAPQRRADSESDPRARRAAPR